MTNIVVNILRGVEWGKKEQHKKRQWDKLISLIEHCKTGSKWEYSSDFDELWKLACSLLSKSTSCSFMLPHRTEGLIYRYYSTRVQNLWVVYLCKKSDYKVTKAKFITLQMVSESERVPVTKISPKKLSSKQRRLY